MKLTIYIIIAIVILGIAYYFLIYKQNEPSTAEGDGVLAGEGRGDNVPAGEGRG